MKFKYKTNVTVNLKDMTYMHIICTRIFTREPYNAFCPRVYVFQLYDEVVAEIPVGMVKDFSYLRSSWDLEPVHFEFIQED